MHPILFKFGPITIYSYGVMVALAFLLSTHLMIRGLRKNPVISSNELIDLLLYGLIFGILGARLLHVLLNLDFYIKDPLQIIFLNRGGLAFHGGIISAIAVSICFLKRRNLAIWRVGDFIVPYIALGHSIGRIGCYLNGCCYGKGNYPLQLYSALGLFIIYVVLKNLYRRKHFDGQIFAGYLILYSLFRFFMDFARGDIFPVFLGLTVSQLISIAVFISGIIILLVRGQVSSRPNT